MNTALASYANLALYSAMVVFALAMLAFTLHLAALKPAPAIHRRSFVLVGSGAGHTAGMAPAEADPSPADRADRDEEAAGPRARRFAGTGLSLTWLGTALLVAAVVLRGVAVTRPPWGNLFEFTTAAACAAAVGYSVLAKRNSWQWLGLFVVGPILLTLGLAMTAFYVEASELNPILKSVWLVIHVIVAIIAVAAFTIALGLGVAYLARLRRESVVAAAPQAKPSFLDALPRSAALERAAYALNMAGFILWTFTLVAGAIWAQKAWGSYWTWDPKEVWTFVVWCIYAAYMHARATAGWEPRKAMYIALAGYAAIVVNYAVVNVFFVGQHSYAGM
jgi:cytochrome c-type biogenesis protein CcsB